MNSPLKILLRRFDDGDSRLRRIAQLYYGAIAAVKDNLVVSRRGERRVFRIRFERLGAKIEQWSANEEELGESLVSFIGILKDYRLSEEQEIAEQQQQLRTTVSSLSSLAETIGRSHGDRGSELEAVTMALERVLFEPDVTRIHETVQHQIRSLKASIVGLSELSFDSSQLVSSDILGLQRLARSQLPEEELPASPERAEHESALEDYMGRYVLFCVLSAEIDGLDEIEQGLGTPARKQIATEFEKRVRRACSDTRTKQIWKNGKVWIILNEAGEQASNRRAKLRINLTPPFVLTSKVGNAELRLPMRMGLTEYVRGEKLEDLMRRLEESAKDPQLVAV